MSSASLDSLMVELEEEAKTTKLEMIQSSIMSIKMKNKLKRRRRSNSRAVHQLMQQPDRRFSSTVIGGRVKTLKGLVPNSHKCTGMDGLFRETAYYILALQLKVRVMQTMINLVSNNSAGGD